MLCRYIFFSLYVVLQYSPVFTDRPRRSDGRPAFHRGTHTSSFPEVSEAVSVTCCLIVALQCCVLFVIHNTALSLCCWHDVSLHYYLYPPNPLLLLVEDFSRTQFLPRS